MVKLTNGSIGQGNTSSEKRAKQSHTIRHRIKARRREFKHREDTFTLEGIVDTGHPLVYCSNEYGDSSDEQGSFEELEINKLCALTLSQAYHGTYGTQNYFLRIFQRPLSDKDVIEKRQETLIELSSNNDIYHSVRNLIGVIDSSSSSKFTNNPKNDYEDELVQNLEEASKLVKLLEAICSLSDSTSPRLKRIYKFGKQIADDKGFKEVRKFVRRLYEPNDLGEVLYKLRRSLFKCDLRQKTEKLTYYAEEEELSKNINRRRTFQKGIRTLYEVTKTLFKSKLFEEFIDEESREMNVLDSLRKKKRLYTHQLFGFDNNLKSFQKRENPFFFEFLEYWLILVNEAIDSRMPTVKIGELSEELRFYLAAVDMQKKWLELGGCLTKPRILPKEDKRYNVVGSYSPILLVDNRQLDDESKYIRPVPNNFSSDATSNIFVITGPNNAGKSTYLKQVGQLCWLAYLGMLLPAQEAEISCVDFLFTSIDRKGDSNKGEGQYMAELARIAQHIHTNDKRKKSNKYINKPNTTTLITPYSLVLFDEFGSGTDHAEAVYRTKILLKYLSELGATTYFTTHKQEIADFVEAHELLGSLNLAMQIKKEGASIVSTYNVLRNAREKSYGHQIAELVGLTESDLKAAITHGLEKKLYPIEATRIK